MSQTSAMDQLGSLCEELGLPAPVAKRTKGGGVPRIQVCAGVLSEMRVVPDPHRELSWEKAQEMAAAYLVGLIQRSRELGLLDERISAVTKIMDKHELARRRKWLGYLTDECMARGLLMHPQHDGTVSLWKFDGKSGAVEQIASPLDPKRLVLEMREKQPPKYEWRAIVEVDGIHSSIESDWEPWEGPEDDVELIQQLVSGMSVSSMGYEAAAEAAGFSYGIQVREIQGMAAAVRIMASKGAS